MDNFNENIFSKVDAFTDPTLHTPMEDDFSVTPPHFADQVPHLVAQVMLDDGHGPVCGAIYVNDAEIIKGSRSLSDRDLQKIASAAGATIGRNRGHNNLYYVISKSPSSRNPMFPRDKDKTRLSVDQSYAAQTFRSAGFTNVEYRIR